MRCWIFIMVVMFAALKAEAGPGVVGEFPFEYREGLLWVEVSVPESQEPLHFLLDTGAGVSVINLSTAKRLGIKLGRTVTVQGVKTNLTGYWPERLKAQAGDVCLPKRYLAADLESLSKSCGHPVDGLIGADFFYKRVVQIDFAGKKIRILSAGETKTDAYLPLEMRPCGIRVPITVEGHSNQWVRLDTGCASSLQWVTTKIPEQCLRKPAIGLAEIVIPQTQVTVGLGPYEFSKVSSGLHSTPIFPGEAGLLGNGLLSRFSSIVVDTRAGRLILATR